MIVSASYRTDIPAYYGEWFESRLNAGCARVRNPYNGSTFIVPLTAPAVDGFVFWTRNLGPFLPILEQAVSARGHAFVVHYTITGYPRALDAATIDECRAVADVRKAVDTYGLGSLVWRYDPVVFTSITPASWHLRNFGRLCRMLSGTVDEVVVSFAHIYRKSHRNLSAAARAFGFEWWDAPAEEKRNVLTEFVELAGEHRLRVTLCGQSSLLVDGAGDARCIDAERLSRIANRPIGVKHKPHRKTCGCWSSRDIGRYDSCPQGCAYCYAVRNRGAAKRFLERHDPSADLL